MADRSTPWTHWGQIGSGYETRRNENGYRETRPVAQPAEPPRTQEPICKRCGPGRSHCGAPDCTCWCHRITIPDVGDELTRSERNALGDEANGKERKRLTIQEARTMALNILHDLEAARSMENYCDPGEESAAEQRMQELIALTRPDPRLAELEAENARLRVVLTEILEISGNLTCARDVAYVALERKS